MTHSLSLVNLADDLQNRWKRFVLPESSNLCFVRTDGKKDIPSGLHQKTESQGYVSKKKRIFNFLAMSREDVPQFQVEQAPFFQVRYGLSFFCKYVRPLFYKHVPTKARDRKT